MEWMLADLALGATVGFLSGLFGIGGGTLLVPALLFLFEAQHFPSTELIYLALGTSMATILFTSTASTLKHQQHGAVIWHVVYTMAPGVLMGTWLGAVSVVSVSQQFLGIFFSLFVCFVAIQILRDVKPHPTRTLPGIAGMALTGVFTGWLSTLVSIGGGTVVIPFLVRCNVALRNAIGTSAAIGIPVAAGGTLGYVVTGIAHTSLPTPNLGFVHLPTLLWVAMASVMTAPLGARAAHRMQVAMLRKLFAILLLVLATRLFLEFI